MLFSRRGETGVPGENLLVQSREPTNSAHILRRIRDSNLGHIGEKHQALTTAPSLLSTCLKPKFKKLYLI